MSLLNFPSNPAVNDTWPVGSKIYKWNGNAWIVLSTSITATTVGAGTISITSTATSTSTTTGAIIVAGGLGVGADVYIGGNITVAGQINGAASTGGVRIESTNTNNIFYIPFVSTASGAVTIVNSDQTKLTYNPSTHQLTAGSIQNTPIGTATPSSGYFTTLQASGISTIANATESTGISSGAFTVAGGVGIGKNLNVGGDLNVNGGFTIRGEYVITTASFDNTPSDGTDIDIVDIGNGILQFNDTSTLDTVTSRGATTANAITLTNTTESTSPNSGALIIAGGLGVSKRINCESIRIADTVFDSSEVQLNTLATAVIDSYSITEFRTAKYLVQIDEGTGVGANFQAVEILLLANNAGNVFATEYGLVTSNGELGTFTADLQIDNIVRLYFTPNAITDKTIYVLRTSMAA